MDWFLYERDTVIKELKIETEILETFTFLIHFKKKLRYYIGEVFKQYKKLKSSP